MANGQTTVFEEHAHHAELANQDEAAAISRGEPKSLFKRFFARLWSGTTPEMSRPSSCGPRRWCSMRTGLSLRWRQALTRSGCRWAQA